MKFAFLFECVYHTDLVVSTINCLISQMCGVHKPVGVYILPTSLSVCTVPLEREGAAVCDDCIYTDRVLPYILHTACKS